VIEDRRPTSEWKFLDDKDFLEIVECLSGGFLLRKRPSAGHFSLESRER